MATLGPFYYTLIKYNSSEESLGEAANSFAITLDQTIDGQYSTFSLQSIDVKFHLTGYNYYLYGTVYLNDTAIYSTGEVGNTYINPSSSSNFTTCVLGGSKTPLRIKHSNDGTLSKPKLSFSFNIRSSSGGLRGQSFGETYIGVNHINTYTITYNANGGTGAPSAQIKLHNVSLSLSSTKPTKASTTAAGYTVTFNGNGGTPSKTSITATDTTTYAFKSWNTKQDGTGTAYSSGMTYTGNANLTLFAQYKPTTSKGSINTATIQTNKPSTTSTRTVSFNAMDNGGIENPSAQTSTATISYSPKGWYDAKTGGTKISDIGGSYSPTSNITLYAQWNTNQGAYSPITLPYVEKNSTEKPVYVYLYPNYSNLPYETITDFQTTYYNLDGWYLNSSNGTYIGSAYTEYTPTSDNEVLYAKFNTGYVNFPTVTLPIFTRPGYEFLGWSTYSGSDSGITGDITLYEDYAAYYAIWKVQGNIRLYSDDWKMYSVHIYHNQKWYRAIPYVYTSQKWYQVGG